MIAFIADAPAAEEVDAGNSLGTAPVPLVGPSGRLFGRLLRMSGLARTDEPPRDWGDEFLRLGLRPLLWERSDHFIGNVWPYKLADNELRSLFAPAQEAKDGGYGEAEWHMGGYGWLRSEHRPALRDLGAALPQEITTVVPLGAAALWAFTGSSAITESRGTVLRASRILPGVKLVPTLHPTHALQDYRFLGVVAADLARAALEATTPDTILHRTARELWVEPGLGDLALWWDRYGAHAESLSVDIETQHGQIDCIAFASDPVHSICVPFVDWRKPSRSYWGRPSDEHAAWEWVAGALASPIPKVFQNGLFDLAYIWGKMGLPVVNYCHDTRLAGHVLQPELPKSLAFLGSMYAHPPGAWKTLRMGEEKRDA